MIGQGRPLLPYSRTGSEIKSSKRLSSGRDPTLWVSVWQFALIMTTVFAFAAARPCHARTVRPAQRLQPVDVEQKLEEPTKRSDSNTLIVSPAPNSQSKAIIPAKSPESDEVTVPTLEWSKTGIRWRITWGGGQPRQWQGKITVSQGNLERTRCLALTPDAPGSAVLAENQIHINHWMPTNYGGVDVSFIGSNDAVVKLVLFAADQPNEKFEQTIAISQLLSEGFAADVDSTGNQLMIVRAPGDQLPVLFKRSHLVFSPGERFSFDVRANRTSISARSANCRVKLFRSGTDGGGNGLALWGDSQVFAINETGSSDLQTFQLEVPKQEGVYELSMLLEPNWYQASFRNANRVERRIQFVVLADDDRSAKPADQNWRVVSEVDITDGGNTRSFPPLPSFTAGRSISNQRDRTINYMRQPMLELSPGGWKAVPISIPASNRPHILEVQFVGQPDSAFGVSIIQPDAAGNIPPFGFDNGVVNPKSMIDASLSTDPTESKIRTHRIVFWPSSKQAYVLFVNRNDKQSAILGSAKLLGGPERLTAQSQKQLKQIQGMNEDQQVDNRRQMMVFYESPLFAENFGALKKIDSKLDQPLDDWLTFYNGADRLIQYLESHGYGGAMINVYRDGSSIFPSERLNPSPKYDSGVFFANGQDPIQKDVLEMLFRMFDRKGLKLVPALTMSSPLPNVESARFSSSEGQQFELVNYNKELSARTLKNELPIYNPLNRLVQKNVSEAVGEMSRRYRGHGSFQGVALLCRPDTCTLLPGRQWGYDAATTQQFLQSQADLNLVFDDSNWPEIQMR